MADPISRLDVQKLSQAVELHLGGHLSAAEAVYCELFQVYPHDANLFEAYAELLLALRQFPSLIEVCGRADEAGLSIERTATYLAQASFHQGRYAEALVILDRLQDQFGEIFAARYPVLLMQRGICRAQTGDPKGARDDLLAAYAAAPEDSDIAYNLALFFLSHGEFSEALKFFSIALEHGCQIERIWISIATAYRGLGKWDEACSAYEMALSVAAETPATIFHDIAVIRLRQGRYVEALASIDRLSSDQQDEGLMLVRAEALVLAGQARAALNLIEECETYLSVANRQRSLLIRSAALVRLGDSTAAVSAARSALAIDSKSSQGFLALGVALQAERRYSSAIHAYESAIGLDPRYVEAWNNKGAALQEAGDFDAALQCYQLAASLDSSHVSAIYNAGMLLAEKGHWHDAMRQFEAARKLEPQRRHLLGHLVHAKCSVADWADLSSLISELRGQARQGSNCSPPFATLAVFTSPSEQLAVAKVAIESQWGIDTDVADQNTGHVSIVSNQPERIQLGYFSADFCEHATSHLLAGVIERHDRSRFVVIGFSFKKPTKDYYGSRVFRAFDEFLDVSEMSDLEVVNLARSRGIDIAIDLKGHTRHARPGIFLRRAAAVQVNYLGFPGSFGHCAMDYIAADSIVVPVGSEQYFSERVARIQGCFQPSDDRRQHPASVRSRSSILTGRRLAGLPEDAFVFCSFNATYKILPDVFSTWCEILARVPRSVLWLMCDDNHTRNRLISEAARNGLETWRIVFADKVPIEAHRGRLCLADLALDTYPCGGHTTCNDLLWAGVPVLAWVGETFASRVAASLLTALGLTDLIAENREQYLAKAAYLAADDNLSIYREALTDPARRARLFDTGEYTRRWEAVLCDLVATESPHLPFHPPGGHSS